MMKQDQDLPGGETERVDLEKLNWNDIRLSRETFSDLTRKIERLQEHTTSIKEESSNTRGVLFVIGLLVYSAFPVTEHLTILPSWMTHFVRAGMFIFTLYFIASDERIEMPRSLRLVFAVVVASMLLLATTSSSSASSESV